MCIFKEKDFKEAKKLNILVGAGIFAVFLACFLPLITIPGEDLATKYASAQLSVSSVAFIIILITLCLTIVQLRKSMAKPKLSLAFSEDGKTEATIDVFKDKPSNVSLALWVTNTGNAVTKTFQIDIKVPEIFTPKNIDTIMPSKLSPTGDTRTYSFYSDGEDYLFVNRSIRIPGFILPLEVNPANYDKLSEKETVKYTFFGDWAETQEGELTIKCNKQEY